MTQREKYLRRAEILKEYEKNTMPTLSERQAKFVYEAGLSAAVAAQASNSTTPWADRENDFKAQFIEAVEKECGSPQCTSPEESHNCWVESYISMGWVYGEKYDEERGIHPNLIPYDHLSQVERNKDEIFLALCKIARENIVK